MELIPLETLKIGSPEYFGAQKQGLLSKQLTKHTYDIWYSKIISDFSTVGGTGQLLELGSGGSYLKDVLPEIITSDIYEGIGDLTVDARSLPFKDETLKGIAMTHSFHHVPDVELFLREADRTLIDGGVISLIEVAKTPLAKMIFTHFHPEPFNETSKDWNFKQENSMNDSNQALSWIVFLRDIEIFKKKFPHLIVERVEFLPWLAYLLAGGVTKPSFIPPYFNPLVLTLDKIRFLDRLCALHWHIRIRKCKK